MQTLERGLEPTLRCAVCHVRDKSIACDITADELAVLEQYKTTSRYAKGDVLFNEGDPPDGIFCVYLGGIKVFKAGHVSRDQMIRFAHPGCLIGYRSLVRNEPHSTSAMAMEPARVCYIPREAIKLLAAADPAFNLRLLTILSKQLGRAEDRIVDLAHRPLRARIAELLLQLRDEFGVDRDGITLHARLSRSELANTVGAATETVIRFLTELKRAGIIDMKGRMISILDPDRLREAASEVVAPSSGRE